MRRVQTSWLKALSGLSINLSAAWYGAVLIAPNFAPINSLFRASVLFYDIVFGTIFLYLAVMLERKQLK